MACITIVLVSRALPREPVVRDRAIVPGAPLAPSMTMLPKSRLFRLSGAQRAADYSGCKAGASPTSGSNRDGFNDYSAGPGWFSHGDTNPKRLRGGAENRHSVLVFLIANKVPHPATPGAANG
jgi:hypothetical protein